MSTNILEESKKRKEQGNRLFSLKMYDAAIACYRTGLGSLPPYDSTADSSTSANNQGYCDGLSSQSRNEIINLEINLRSNIALALQKLAEEKQLPPLPGGVATNNQEEVDKLYTQIEEECNRALQLDDSMTPKLYHRRGLARQYFAEQNQLQLQLQCDGASSDEAKLRVDELFSLAEADLKKAISILQSTGVSQKEVDAACKALQNLSMKREGNASLPEQQQSFASPQIQANGFMEIGSGGDGEGVPPSPQAQRDYILHLLSRSTPSSPIIHGEAYFLIDMQWWQSWCQYVGLFAMYTTTSENNDNNKNNRNGGGRSPMKVKQHCRKIDTSNQQILQLLPPGATLPPYLEQDRNKALYPKEDEKEKEKE